MYKEDNLQRLICNKTQPNQTKLNSGLTVSLYDCVCVSVCMCTYLPLSLSLSLSLSIYIYIYIYIYICLSIYLIISSALEILTSYLFEFYIIGSYGIIQGYY